MSVGVDGGNKRFLKASEAGDALGVSPKTVGRWVKLHERDGLFPQLGGAYFRTLGRHLRIDPDRLDAFKGLAEVDPD